ncbi:hypothetical protein DPMN_087752 [Dreissena polymorpha]|uniref:Uncharacterized protein n=1 Tax=Dreissena polymorpha TaxID=45954 RepID=A0A9D4KUF7_DREPO|nr:hypothetical protein DPMN_087692 [Dreissena polymorpha]KAH3845471.1 hypothetical protein DPMN_087752 [Dreissena polymorpha]
MEQGKKVVRFSHGGEPFTLSSKKPECHGEKPNMWPQDRDRCRAEVAALCPR